MTPYWWSYNFSCSFGMAYDFIDCIGDDVDVVSDSEVWATFYLANWCWFVIERNRLPSRDTVYNSYPNFPSSPGNTEIEPHAFCFFFNSDMNSSLLNTCIIRHSYNNLILCQIQNIKKLLKIPFSKSHVSMAVHRVGRTLLLDELDIQELFMRSSQVLQWFLLKQNPSVLFCGVRVIAVFAVSAKVCSPFVCASKTGDWTWLKEFYQRLIDQKWQRKKKSKEHWYQRAILSKFLYYRSVNVGDFE